MKVSTARPAARTYLPADESRCLNLTMRSKRAIRMMREFNARYPSTPRGDHVKKAASGNCAVA